MAKKAVKPIIKKAAKKAATKKRAANKTAASAKLRLTKEQLAARAVKREIARRNKIFSAASQAEKRVLIAKDVIEQIKLRRILPESGHWVNPGYYAPFNMLDDAEEANRSVQQDLLTGELDRCSCCALGAVFVSCTLFNNQTTAADLERIRFDLGELVDDGQKLSNGMNKFFSRSQLVLIEQAFEGGQGQFSVDWGRDDGDDPIAALPAATRRILSWEERYPDDKDRLVAIMKNIIKNNGTFKP